MRECASILTHTLHDSAGGAAACISACVVSMECVSHSAEQCAAWREGLGKGKQQQQQQGSEYAETTAQAEVNGGCESGGKGSGSGPAQPPACCRMGTPAANDGSTACHSSAASHQCTWLAHLSDGLLGSKGTLGLYLHSGAQQALLSSAVMRRSESERGDRRGAEAAGQDHWAPFLEGELRQMKGPMIFVFGNRRGSQ